jgi:1-acyl-sn-glycerol-3-phosphate acyltransferase
MKVKGLLVSFLVWLFFGFTMVLFFVFYIVLWVFSFPFDRKQYFIQWLTWCWASFYAKVFPFWSIELINKERLVKGKACVAVSNHQSLLDIMVLFHLYAYFIWVSKLENFKAPILGQVMTLNRYISLVRNDPRTFPKMFEDISKALKNNKTVMIFPEGTRSLTDYLGRFKEGAFKAAIDNKVPIVPIVIDGAGRAIPKKGKTFAGRTKITVKVLDEIKYEDFPSYDPVVLKEYVKGIIEQELKIIQSATLK